MNKTIFIAAFILLIIGGGGYVASTSGVRGIRNNNPGNIRLGSLWKGRRAEQTDSAFVQFETMEYGIRALAIVLRNYEKKHKLFTIRQIINRYAPPIENNTSAYVNAVAKDLNRNADSFFSVKAGDNLFHLIRAIIKHENGHIPAATISDRTIVEGIKLA